MGSSETDLNIIDSVVTVAGGIAAIFAGIAGAAGLAAFFGTGGGS
ncbi:MULTISPECIES: hypothetical protein [Rhodococcus]|nr:MULTISPECIES: hypothetical protein [Rhodococcus]MDV8065244.1 hypothetical protein [Rhodococcus sp. IEGM 1366]